MKYGIHTPLVEEVIDFAKGDGLLQSQSQSQSQSQGTNANWHIVHDLNEAKRFAEEATIGPDEYLWTELRELQMADVRGQTYEMKGFADAREALTETLKLFTMFVRRRLDEEHSELMDDIVGDLYSCAFSRAVDGDHRFFEVLFRAYRAGGWPCGWLGDYPAGQLVVYMRM